MRLTYIVRAKGHEARGSTPERAISHLPEEAQDAIPDGHPVFGSGDINLNITRVYHA